MQAGREIKFRGKPIEDYGDVKWFYGSAVLDYEEKLAYIVSSGQGHVPVEWESVGQYTGLCDANNTPIYEGDILEDFFSKKRYEVIWDSYGMFLFNPVGTKGSAIDYYEFEDEVDKCATIVVGNRYENPNLLEVGN